MADLKIPGELEVFRTAVTALLMRLDKALQQQKQFTADASHELRTPLAVAKSTLQVARTRDRDIGQYRRAIDETLEDLARMERLIQQLFILARMDADELVSQAVPVRLDVFLMKLAGTFDSRASRMGGRVVCEALPAVGVRGNEDLLIQLFSNLLGNAVEHGPAGGTIRVTLRAGTAGDCAVCIQDEGGNIPVEVLGRLFDRFYRADASRERATGGAGLGLAIARAIARHHGGDVAITSDRVSGTRVCVRLPQVAASEPIAATAG